MTSSAAIQQLKKDPVLRPLIRRTGVLKVTGRKDLYLSMLRSIVGQQLSVKAAETIWTRFLQLFPEQYPEPEALLDMQDDRLRSAGLSRQKGAYLRNIATFSMEHSLDYKVLKKMDDESLIEYLSQIKGVGRWTAEMLLMFSLARPDVFPLDDLGIQNGMRSLYNLRQKDSRKLKAAMLKIAEQWKPFRTLACLYIWQHKDGGN